MLWDCRDTSKSVGHLCFESSSKSAEGSGGVGMLTSIRCGQSAETATMLYAGYENGAVGLFDIRTRRY